jgi:hypothetical protein
MRWMVFYADGSTFSSDQGAPEDAPKDYVEVVLQESKEGRELIDGMATDYEFYCWHGDRWIIHNQNGLDQYLAMPDSPKVYLRGFYIPDEQFREIHIAALDHPDWQGLDTRIVRASEWTK